MQVYLRDGESFESLLKRFKSGVAKHGILSEYKRHQSFVSKAERVRAKAKKAERKRAIKAAKSAAAA